MPIPAPKHVLSLLDRLHAKSTEQEKILAEQGRGDIPFDDYMRDKYIALEQDKCEYIYTLIRTLNAKTVVEAGTSYGVSTIYLALAALKTGGKVIATENEPEKIKRARAYWTEAGEDIESAIDLREGDILQTLKTDLKHVDLLLLDIWAPISLAVLKVVLPNLRRGAVVIIDNITGAADRYADLIAFLHDEQNGFVNTVIPYHNGLGMSIYDPRPET